MTWTSSLLVLALLYVALKSVSSVFERQRIKRLGALPTKVPNYLPLGIDVILRSVKCSWTNRDLDLWKWFFGHVPHDSDTIETCFGGQRYIFTADPENIKAILATQFRDYGKGQTFFNDWRPFLGSSIFTTDGDLWHASRQLIRPQFAKERVKDLDIFEEQVQKVIAQLGGSGQPVDIAALFYRFALDATTAFLLGQSVGSLDSPHADFVEAFNEAQRIQNLVGRTGPMNIFVPRFSMWKSLKIINHFVKPFIDTVLRINVHDLKERSNDTLLESMAAQGMRDPDHIRDQIVAVLLAGRDTTAGALSFLFQELSRHPIIFAKLRKEILEVVGANERPTYEQLKEMPYLKNAINEVLRLYPSVPFNVRTALQDTTLPKGGGSGGQEPIGILKDTPIVYSTLYMQLREDRYPVSEDLAHPHVFSPERWERWHPKSWRYIPFNGGPRICIGQQFALTEIGYTVVRILQRFAAIEYLASDEDLVYKSEIVMSPLNGVKIGCWAAK